MRRLLSLLLVAGTAGCATRALPASTPYEGYLGTFPSGMRVVVYGYPESAGASAVHVSYLTGMADEPPGQEGIRELARRLSFLSRPEGPGSPSLGERLKVSGTGGASGLEVDEVYFTALNSTLQLPRLLEFEALRMREPLAHVTETEFLEARETLARERLSAWNIAYPPDQLMRRELFAGHPYGQPLMGTAASVRALTLEAVRAWARAHFTPDRTVLVVMGGVPPKEVAAAVTATFGELAAGPVAKPLASAAPPLPGTLTTGKVVKRPSSVGYPQLWVVWRAPGESAGRYSEATMMAESLRTGVLPFVASKVKGAMAKQNQVGLWTADGVTLIYLMVEVGHGEDVEPLVATVKDRLSLSWGAMMGDLTAKAQRDGALRRAQGTLEQRTPHAVAWYLRTTGRADLRGWPHRVKTTPLAEIRGYARDYLRAEEATFLLLVPPEDMDLKGPPKI